MNALKRGGKIDSKFLSVYAAAKHSRLQYAPTMRGCVRVVNACLRVRRMDRPRRRPPAPHTHNRRRSDRSFGNRPGDPGGGGVGDVGFEASTYFRCKLAYDIDGTMTRVAQLNLPDCTVRKVNLEDQSVLLGTVHTQ